MYISERSCTFNQQYLGNYFCFNNLSLYRYILSCIRVILLFAQATTLAVPPPIMVRLAKDPIVEQYDLSSLKTLITGAAPLSSSLIHELQAKLKATVRQSV